MVGVQPGGWQVQPGGALPLLPDAAKQAPPGGVLLGDARDWVPCPAPAGAGGPSVQLGGE